MQSAFKRNIANLLSLFRLISILPLTYLSYLKLKAPFLVFYPLAGFTDILDGCLARRFKTESKLGRKLDSLADFLFTTATFLWAYLFKVREFEKILIPFLLVIGYAILIQAVSLLKFKKFGLLHLWSLKILFLPSLVMVFYMILTETVPFLVFYLLIFLSVIGYTEILLILLVSKKDFDESITSIFQLKKSKRSCEEKLKRM